MQFLGIGACITLRNQKFHKILFFDENNPKQLKFMDFGPSTTFDDENN